MESTATGDFESHFMLPGMTTRAKFLEVQEHMHRKVMEVDFFAPWILTHDCIKGI